MGAWFDAIVDVEPPTLDGSLAAERNAAEAHAQMGKGEHARCAYRAAIGAWCTWCAQRGLPSPRGPGADVAAFLAARRGRGLTPKTLVLRRAASCAVPTDDVAVYETMAGISREAARQGYTPRKKVAATATILHQVLGRHRLPNVSGCGQTCARLRSPFTTPNGVIAQGMSQVSSLARW